MMLVNSQLSNIHALFVMCIEHGIWERPDEQ